MRVKRFVGDNVQDTISKVKRELGADAVILQTRKIKEGGLFGLFGKPKVEIIAAVEDNSPPLSKSFPGHMLVNGKSPHSPVAAAPPAGDHNSTQPTLPEWHPVHQELEQLRKALDRMSKQLESVKATPGASAHWPGPLAEWYELLRRRGISEYMSGRLVEQVRQTLDQEEWTDRKKVYQRIEASVRQICSNTAAIRPGIDRPRVVALIGPTGVGKTTTIGKLAAGFSIVDRRRVALITADTYRVAAVEQLRIFAEIIGVPLDVVTSPESLLQALGKHEDKELIFLDTAGRSPHYEVHMKELQAFLDCAKPDLTLLVMSATTSVADQKRIYERFSGLATHLAFTKLDEAVAAGSILDILAMTDLPTAYLTTGQNVPDDIELATTDRLTRYILGEEKLYV